MVNALITVHRLLQGIWVCLLLMSGCLWWAKRQLRRQGAFVVLMFHRVLDEEDLPRSHSLPDIVVRKSTFERLAAYLAKRCEAVGIRDAEPGAAGSKVKVALTFDDGWHDNFTTALPIARAHDLPLTVFICPGLSGRNSPFWPERAVAMLSAARPAFSKADMAILIEHLKTFTPERRDQMLQEFWNRTGAGRARAELSETDSTLFWDEILEMDRAGVTFGSHTNTHQVLTSLPPGEVRREIRDSKVAIQRALRKPCDCFAYPNGDWSEEARELVAEEGFSLAFTTARGAWTPECDRLAIPRSNICEQNLAGPAGGFWPAMFEYTTFWKTWRALKASSRPATRVNRRREPAAA